MDKRAERELRKMDFVIFVIGNGSELQSRALHNSLPAGARLLYLERDGAPLLLISEVEAQSLNLSAHIEQCLDYYQQWRED
jgi:hypothetical protein